MKFKYEDLEVWQLSIDLIKIIYKILDKFPKNEQFNLIAQGKRAVVSIALNIVEGSGRHTDKDFASFINRSTCSLQEVDGILKVGIALDYITAGDYDLAAKLIEKEYFKLIAFEKALRRDI